MTATQQLPAPKLIWTGSSTRALTNTDKANDARLVLRYRIVKEPADKDFAPEPEVVYEVIAGTDALGAPVWKSEPLGNIPVSFFVESFGDKL